MTEKLGVTEKEPAFGQKTPDWTGTITPALTCFLTWVMTVCSRCSMPGACSRTPVDHTAQLAWTHLESPAGNSRPARCIQNNKQNYYLLANSKTIKVYAVYNNIKKTAGSYQTRVPIKGGKLPQENTHQRR